MAVVSVVAVTLGLALAACSGTGDPAPSKPASSSFVGNSLQYALDHTPGSVASRDVSKSLALPAASPEPEASAAVVIAACYHNDTQLNVVTIPSDSVTSSIDDHARQGKFNSLLDGCGK